MESWSCRQELSAFLFTDIEGSTRLLAELGDGYADALAEHRRVLRRSFERHHGVEVDTQGDALFVAFGRATDRSRRRSTRRWLSLLGVFGCGWDCIPGSRWSRRRGISGSMCTVLLGSRQRSSRCRQKKRPRSARTSRCLVARRSVARGPTLAGPDPRSSRRTRHVRFVLPRRSSTRARHRPEP